MVPPTLIVDGACPPMRWASVMLASRSLLLATVLVVVVLALSVEPARAAPFSDGVPPTVETLDPGAEALRPIVEKHLRAVVDLTDEQMGWRPDFPITVYVATDVKAAVANAERVKGTVASAREGTSETRRERNGSAVTTFVALNLTHRSDRSEEVIRAFLAHEWTHAAQLSMADGNRGLPVWFFEGQAVYQELRNSSPIVSGRYLKQTVQDSRAGAEISLVNLGTLDQWNMAIDADRWDSAYGRGYAAVRYLAEQYGFAATLPLLTESHQDQQRFWQLIKDLTGLDPVEFDQAVSTYLRSPDLRSEAASS
jgi:hypothetical protein